MKVRAGMRILDVGCGMGADCFVAANQVGAGGFVYGIDPLEEMIQQANNLKNIYKFENICFFVGLETPLPFEHGTMDIVMTNYSFHLFESKSRDFRQK